jgi:integrase
LALSNKLTNRDIKAALRHAVDKPRVISDGDGLYLRVRPGQIASWFFASNAGGRRRELGLGSATAVDLDTARELAGDVRKAIAQGRDPFAEKAASKRESKEAARVPTFGEFAEDYIASVEAGWKNSVHRAQWRQTIRDYAGVIADKRVDEVTTDDVLKVLRPIWTVKPETASRLRGRIEKILSAAKVRGLRHRDSINPASYRGHLDILLPRQQREARGHHGALPFADAPEFMTKLRARPALAARALEFAILTAARTGECIGARWGEIDERAAVWTVPASRMKAKVEHRVPLSTAALALLKALKPKEHQPGDLIFADRGKPLSNMAMLALLKRMKVEVTTHGFRSTFRDWCGDEAGYPRELAEAALAHTIQSKSERAYRRGTAVELRRSMMESWAAFLGGAQVAVLAA